MNVEVNHVIEAGAMPLLRFFQATLQRLVSPGPQNVDSHPQASLTQGIDQRSGDGAVAHIALAARPGADHQQVDCG